MLAAQLFQLLRAAPFRPFRIHMSNGRALEIKHPEAAWLTMSHLEVATKMNSLGVPDEVEFCSLLHIERTEPQP